MGYRGEVCARFGWTYQYFLWGVSSKKIDLMMADASHIEYDKHDGGGNSGQTLSKQDRIEKLNNHLGKFI